MSRIACARQNILTRPSIRLLGVVVGLLSIGLTRNDARATAPALPEVELVVQIRLISDAELAADEAVTDASTPAAQRGLSISSANDGAASAQTQEIHVRNGEQASVSWSQAMPFQWQQAAEVRGRAARAAGGGVVNALIWLQAGQSLSVHPSWPGGRHAARVDLRLEAERIGDRQGPDVPSSSRQASATTLSVPVGRWTTFAATGTAPPLAAPSTWSTQALHASGRQLMQLRVTPR